MHGIEASHNTPVPTQAAAGEACEPVAALDLRRRGGVFDYCCAGGRFRRTTFGFFSAK
jgi:hypothetical protein